MGFLLLCLHPDPYPSSTLSASLHFSWLRKCLFTKAQAEEHLAGPFARSLPATLLQGVWKQSFLKDCPFARALARLLFGKTCPFARVSLLQGLCKPATLLQGFPFARGERLTLLQGCPWQGFAFCKAFLYLFPKVCLLQGFAFCKACYTFLQRLCLLPFARLCFPFARGWNLPFCKGLISYSTTY